MGLGVASFAALLASSCLTPDFNFDPLDPASGGTGASAGTGGTIASGGDGAEGGQGGEGAANHCENGEQDASETDADCGGDCAGCDLGKTCSSDSDCLPSPSETGRTSCVNETCTLLCDSGLGDCNARLSDGCEIDLRVSENHCGACNAACDLPQAESECRNSECRIKKDEPNQGCDPNFSDCNFDDQDGCEANLMRDSEHCGSCEAECSGENGKASCESGQCDIECEANFEDCDENARGNGCETNISINSTQCGGCDLVCPSGSSTESASCVDGICGLTDCGTAENKGDCDGDGVCDEDLDTLDNCGGCGLSCSVAHGTPICDASGAARCDIGACDVEDDKTWLDCDDDYDNGCEVNVEVNRFRCGGCLASDDNPGSGEDCTALEADGSKHVAATTCEDGGCMIVGCDSGYVDCNKIASDGCEVDVTSSSTQCGGCSASAPNQDAAPGVDCTSFVGPNNIASVICDEGSCAVNSCSGSGPADCNESIGDGCEKNLNSDVAHCGMCNQSCANRPNATPSCTLGNCSWTCDPQTKDANNDLGNPNSDGCETRVIQLVGSQQAQSAAQFTDLSFSHTLLTSRTSNQYRAVVLLLTSKGNWLESSDPPTVTYAGQNMTAEVVEFSGNQIWTGIFVVTDANLPSSAGSHGVLVDGDQSNNFAWHAQLLELTNVNQAQPIFSGAGQGEGGMNCNASLALTSLPTDSWMLSLVALEAGVDLTFGALSGQASLAEQSTDISGNIVQSIVGYRQPVAGSQTIAWGCSGADRWAHVVASLQPQVN